MCCDVADLELITEREEQSHRIHGSANTMPHPNWSYTTIQAFIDELAVFPIGNDGEIAGDYI